MNPTNQSNDSVSQIIQRFFYAKNLRLKYHKAMEESLIKYPVNNPFDKVPFEDPRVFEFITPEDYVEIIEVLHATS
jgi:predicted GH43/DUF377 family glycosyl hydrolase